jgi:hypothetical protein
MKRFEPRYLFMLAAMVFFFFLNAQAIDGDFPIFYQSSRLFLLGLDPYGVAGHPENNIGGFTYPPLAIFVTLIPALVPLGFALLLWTFLSVLMLAITLYLWMDLLLDGPPEFPDFALSFVMIGIAPVIWSFWLHQLTMPVLLATTVATWLIVRKKNSFGSGLVSGLMLLKPHLTLLALALLTFRAPNKGKFFSGFLIMALLPWLSFLNGHHARTQFHEFEASVLLHNKNLYSRDEQGIPAALYKNLFLSSEEKRFLKKANVRRSANFMSALPFVEKLNHFKTLAFAGVFLAWTVWMILKTKIQWPLDMALALAIAVLFSSYSHLYDGMMLIPIVLIIGVGAARDVGLSLVACVAFFINFVFTFTIPFNLNLNTDIFWERTSHISLIYAMLLVGLWMWKKHLHSGHFVQSHLYQQKEA